jgi:hypothetical protein
MEIGDRPRFRLNAARLPGRSRKVPEPELDALFEQIVDCFVSYFHLPGLNGLMIVKR